MVMNKKIVFRVKSNEHERIRNKAYAMGFSTVSAYLRDFSLRNSLIVEMRVADMEKRMKRMEKMLVLLHRKFT